MPPRAASGAEVRSTYHHPYWVVSGEDLDERPTPDQLGEQLQSVPGVEGRWVDAGDLRPGDVLLSRTGGESTVESVEATHTPGRTLTSSATEAAGRSRICSWMLSGG